MEMLKFITEDYLKDLYRKQTFKDFDLKEGQRLTPGGRQYLLDKGIKINSNLPTSNKNNFKEEKLNVEENIKIDKFKNDIEENLNKNRLIYKFKALETLFISSASEILNEDIKLAQRVVDLGRNIKSIRESIEENRELEIVINKDNNIIFETFEVTDIYMHLKNSKSILNLYYLFCKLQEFKYEIVLSFQEEELDKVLMNLEIIGNTLVIIIKKEVGEI